MNVAIAKKVAQVATAAMIVAGCEKIPGTKANLIAKGQEIAAAALIDPSSAQFRADVVQEARPADGGKPTKFVCGEINGKNRMGAYAGFTRYMVRLDAKQTYLDPAEDVSDEDIDRAKRDCDEERSSTYTFSHYQCDDYLEKLNKKLNQLQFDGAWQGTCTPEAKNLSKAATKSPKPAK